MCVCIDRRHAKKTASARFEATLQSPLEEKFSHTMASLSLLVYLMRDFPVANGSWRDVGGVSSLVAWYVSLTGDPDENGVA